MQHCVHTESSTRCLGTTFCAARRGAARARSFQCSTWVFSSFTCKGKIRHVPWKKTVLREKFGSRCGTAGLERAGSGWQGWWAWPGWRAWQGLAGMGGWGGWGTCMFLHKKVRRNRLECQFGVEYRGKIRYYLLDFFREVQNISLVFLDFSRGKKPAYSRGKSSAITMYHKSIWNTCLRTCVACITCISIPKYIPITNPVLVYILNFFLVCNNMYMVQWYAVAFFDIQ